MGSGGNAGPMSTREERALQRAEQREKVLASPPPTQKAKAPEEAPRPVLLQCFLAASLAAATYASVQQLPDGIYVSGRTSAHVWWYGWVTALSTGLGALPMLVFRHVSDFWLGVCNAVAAGMMTAASAALLSEGLELSSPPDATLTPRQGVALGALVGVGFIMASQKVLESYEDVKLAVLDVVDMRKALLLVMVMTLHSFSEGIGIGDASRETQTRERAQTRARDQRPAHTSHAHHQSDGLLCRRRQACRSGGTRVRTSAC
tara:strand:- start:916 stop:1698 length:783 start_codon:yes stop_codon:yes gene_type:complete